MATIKLRYVNKVYAKGRIYYRYRRAGQLIPLPCDPASPEFMESYKRIHDSFSPTSSIDLVVPGTLAALVTDFRSSADYTGLSSRTKDLYIAHLDDIRQRFGRYPVKSMTRNVVLTYRDSMTDNPGKANNAMKILSRLYSFAIDRSMADVNPVLRVKKLKMGSYRPWTQQEVAKFYENAPAHMRLVFMLALYTGQRQADILKMRWDQIVDEGIKVRQQKTAAEVWIPLHRKLRSELKLVKAKAKTLTIAATRNGKPYVRDWFLNEWKQTTRKVGLPEDCVFHGLRKTAAVYLAEAGCTNEQIKSITGHTTESMVAHYTRGANQKTLAMAAIKKFEGKVNNSKSAK